MEEIIKCTLLLDYALFIYQITSRVAVLSIEMVTPSGPSDLGRYGSFENIQFSPQFWRLDQIQGKNLTRFEENWTVDREKSYWGWPLHVPRSRKDLDCPSMQHLGLMFCRHSTFCWIVSQVLLMLCRIFYVVHLKKDTGGPCRKRWGDVMWCDLMWCALWSLSDVSKEDDIQVWVLFRDGLEKRNFILFARYAGSWDGCK